jgi:hypothetical protein
MIWGSLVVRLGWLPYLLLVMSPAGNCERRHVYALTNISQDDWLEGTAVELWYLLTRVLIMS